MLVQINLWYYFCMHVLFSLHKWHIEHKSKKLLWIEREKKNTEKIEEEKIDAKILLLKEMRTEREEDEHLGHRIQPLCAQYFIKVNKHWFGRLNWVECECVVSEFCPEMLHKLMISCMKTKRKIEKCTHPRSLFPLFKQNSFFCATMKRKKKRTFWSLYDAV